MSLVHNMARLLLVHSMNFVSVKMHDPPQELFLHEIGGTHPNDTQ